MVGLAGVLALAAGAGAQAGQLGNDDWRQFRGPGARGVVDDAGAGLPDTWSTTENVAWASDIPGLGWSSPIVTGGTVVLTSVVSDGEVETPAGGLYFGGDRDAPSSVHQWNVYALDVATGALQWERTVHSGVPETAHHLKNTFASETPVTDGERLYISFGNVGLFCFDLAGQLLWSRDVEPSRTRYGWGTASSPVFHDGRILQGGENRGIQCQRPRRNGGAAHDRHALGRRHAHPAGILRQHAHEVRPRRRLSRERRPGADVEGPEVARPAGRPGHQPVAGDNRLR